MNRDAASQLPQAASDTQGGFPEAPPAGHDEETTLTSCRGQSRKRNIASITLPNPSWEPVTAMKAILLASLTLTIVASPALAVSPVIRGMKPVGGQRGTEVVVTLTGQRLGDAKEILFYQPGIRVMKIEAGKDDQVKATLQISQDTPPGLYDFRLRTATGITALRTFSVGVLDEVNEAEPNNDFAKPQPISMNVTVNGVAANEDIDYYAVKAKKGERITVEIEGIRLGLTLFDPYVAILNAKRFELASSDDSALVWQDGLVSRGRPRGRHLHHRSPARPPMRATPTAFIACMSAISRGQPRRYRPAASSVRRLACAGSATCWARRRRD